MLPRWAEAHLFLCISPKDKKSARGCLKSSLCDSVKDTEKLCETYNLLYHSISQGNHSVPQSSKSNPF